MSECVVWMEMPKHCEYCPMCRLYRENGRVWCNAANRILKQEWKNPDWTELDIPKPDWCPIICSLPEGHGRLVDADDLERYWLSRIALMDSCAGKGGILESVERSTLRSCIEDIGNSKTIVPAEAERSET